MSEDFKLTIDDELEPLTLDLGAEALTLPKVVLPSLGELEMNLVEEVDLPDISLPSGLEVGLDLGGLVLPSELDSEGEDIDSKQGEPDPHVDKRVEGEVVSEGTFSEDSPVGGEISGEEETPREESRDREESKGGLVVTPNGYTLDEMIQSHRKGKGRRVDDYVEDLKRKSGVIDESHYTKAKARATKNEEQDRLRKVAANKGFIQRNTRYTEDEKILMRNLGLEPKEFTRIMGKQSNLNRAEKEKLLSIGLTGGNRYFKGKRTRPAYADMDLIEFLAKFKLGTERILSRIYGESPRTTLKRLQRLKEAGLVYDTQAVIIGTVWYLTEAGMALSGYSFKTQRQNPHKLTKYPPVIAANYIAACLWNGKMNVLSLEEFPVMNRERDGKPLYGEVLISELEIRSSFGKQAVPDFNPGREKPYSSQEEIAQRAHSLWHEWERSGRPSESPEFEEGNEYLYALFPEGPNLGKIYHVPDLVVRRERAEDGSPRSIAVELELNQKKRSAYRATLLAYKMSEQLYEKVIWVTHSTSIAKALAEVASEVGLENFDVVPLVNERGIYKGKEIWGI